MIIFELTGTESSPVYKAFESANLERQYDFLESLVGAAIRLGRPFLSQQIIKSLNYHAIVSLHVSAGEYRPCPVKVGRHNPPAVHKVPALMDDLVNWVNRNWDTDTISLATLVLWKLNQIHPFINGNGRTARAVCHYIICVKSGGWLPGTPILPELLKRNRDEYVAALQEADVLEQSPAKGRVPFERLRRLVERLLAEQLDNVGE